MAGSEHGIGLTLTLVPGAPSVASGQAQSCRLVLRNEATVPLRVNRRLAVNHPVSPPHLREVDFLVQDAHGRVAEFAAKVRIGLPGPEDFAELAPGETVERPFDLTFYYDIVPGEEYQVQAVYENYFVPENLMDAPVWKGRLMSHPLQMTPAMEAPVLA